MKEREENQEQYPIIRTLLEALPAPIIDEVSNKVSYTGYAVLGARFDQPFWKITRTTKANATVPQGVVIVEYADGDMNYDNIWANRATLNYSR